MSLIWRKWKEPLPKNETPKVIMVIYLTHNLIGRVAGYEIKVYLVDFKNSNESLFNIFLHLIRRNVKSRTLKTENSRSLHKEMLKFPCSLDFGSLRYNFICLSPTEEQWFCLTISTTKLLPNGKENDKFLTSAFEKSSASIF